jgi:TRAP transporter TAXI family solute receptor
MTPDTPPCVRRRTLLATAGAVAAGGAGSVALLAARQSDAPTGPFHILSGGTQGVYYIFGMTLAKQVKLRAGDLTVVTESTDGSVENLKRLAQPVAGGPVVIALAAADAAALALRGGQSPFRTPLPPMRALTRLYDDYLHLVVRAGSDIDQVSKLRGRRVSVGRRNSGTALIARRVLELAGLTKGGSLGLTPLEFSINESVDALRSREIDAFFWSGGVPTGGVEELARDLPITLVPMEREATELHTQYGRSYRVGTIPDRVYGLAVPVGTVAVPNLLLTHPDTPASTVRWIDEVLFEAKAAISRDVKPVNTLDPRTAISVTPLALHQGALDYFRANKL